MNNKNKHFKLELKNHFDTGFPMIPFYHLVYYNFNSENKNILHLKMILANHKIFKPYYRKLKKLRNRNQFPFNIDYLVLNKLLSEIECKNIDRSDYYFKRREFKSLRNKIFKKLYETNKKCKYCGSNENLSVDHVLALFNGGNNNLGNMQILCRSCNSKKGIKLNYTA